MLSFIARIFCATQLMEQTPPFPSPEELKSKLAEFMKSNFGDRVAFTTLTQPDTVETGTDEKSPPEEAKDFDFHFLPRDIKAHLDRFVIKQDERKKVLSIAVCDHYNHVNHVRQLEKERTDGAVRDGYAKQNVILVGPTGVGKKTYLIKHIADLIKVPFVKADATKLARPVTSVASGRFWCGSWCTKPMATLIGHSSESFTSTKSTRSHRPAA